MYNLTLISTRHDNIGKCNSKELYQILEHLRPEVIFEEIPPKFFDAYYLHENRSNLETEAIQTYLKTNKAEHIPVDINNIPDTAFFKNYQKAIERIERLKDVNGFNYRHAVDNNKRYAALYGFPYLNSDYAIAYSDEIRDMVKKALEVISDDELFKTCNLWDELNNTRENEMLQNIYSYSKQQPYDRAVFLLGAAHRKAIIDKIKNREKVEALKINWLIFSAQSYKPLSSIK